MKALLTMTALFALLSAGRTRQRSLVQQIRPPLRFLMFLPSFLLAGIASLGCGVEFSSRCIAVAVFQAQLCGTRFVLEFSPKFMLQKQLQYVLHGSVCPMEQSPSCPCFPSQEKSPRRDRWALRSCPSGCWSELGCLSPPEHPPRSTPVGDVGTRPTAAELQPAP